MQASIENLEGLKRLITVTVPAEDVKKAYAASLRNVAKSARIDGFRKGHIPTKVLEMHFGPRIVSDAYDYVINKTLPEAFKSCNVNPASTPEIKFGEGVNGNMDADLTYEAHFEVMPTLEEKPLSEMPLTVVQSKISDADIDKMIESLRAQQGKWQVTDEAEAAEGKLVKIDFVGTINGEAFEGGSANDFSLVIGRTAMIPGFSEQIVGHKAGDKFTINVKFPDDYHAEELKGKDAQFEITVNSVSEQKLPELDDAFFKMFGINEGGLEAFRADLLRNMEREQKRALHVTQRNNICDALLNYFGEFDVPAELVENERKRLCEAEAMRFKSYNIPVKEDLSADPEYHKQDALNAVRLRCILDLYVKKSGLQAPSDDSVNEELNLVADAYEDPEALKQSIRANKEQFSAIRNQAFERDLFNYIQNSAKCEVKEETFSELLRVGQMGF